MAMDIAQLEPFASVMKDTKVSFLQFLSQTSTTV